MEVGKAQRVKIISGSPAEVEAAVNPLLDDYVAASWSFGIAGEKVVVTCLLLHVGEMQKAAARQQAGAIAIPKLNGR